MIYLWIKEDPETIMYFKSPLWDKIKEKIEEYENTDWGITPYAEVRESKYQLI